jgi:hypothetical protein
VERRVETPTKAMLPNLLLLGAAKSGTSSLYRYLAQHPDVFMTTFKEPHFFAWDGGEYDVRGPNVERIRTRAVRDLDSYLRLFSDARDERVRGEASTGYLHTPGVAERIRAYVPHARLIAVLRNPIDRAYSAFTHARRIGWEPLTDFEEALRLEQRRLAERWIGLTLYTTVGRYARHLDRYLAVFPCDQIRVYLFDDLVKQPTRLAQDVFRFVGVDDEFQPDVTMRNRGRAVRSVRLGMLSRTVRRSRVGRRLPSRPFGTFLRAINDRPIDQLPDPTRRRLADEFEPDIAQLSRLLGRDLSPWLTGNAISAVEPGGSVGMHPCP